MPFNPNTTYAKTHVPYNRQWVDAKSTENLSYKLDYQATFSPGRFNSTGRYNPSLKWRMPSSYSRGGCSVHSITQGLYRRKGRSWGSSFIDEAGYGINPEARNVPSVFGISQNLTELFVPTNVSNRARTEILLKVSQGNFNLGVALAEAKETYKGIAVQTIALIKAYTAARRGNWREALRYLALNENKKFKSKDIASRWLELQFGWLPLLADIHDAYNDLMHVKLQKGLRLRAQRTVGTSLACSSRFSGQTGTFQGTRTISQKWVIWFEISDPRLAWMSSLGLLNPLGIVWEKTGFSFLLDWLVPVGNMLESLTAPLGCSFLSGTITDKSTGSGVVLMDEIAGWETLERAKFSCTHEAIHRSYITSWPTAAAYCKSPFSINHALDALALFRQRLK